ncbi:hypothetical protein P885DRAFT_70077 [Corynascus similis CBS 632.67]
MADHARRDQESMYCHACHHQWQRVSESIECPQCMSASTEIVRQTLQNPLHSATLVLTALQVSPENDPRDFHNRRSQDTTSTDARATASSNLEPNHGQNAYTDSTGNNNPSPASDADTGSGNTQHAADGQRPRVTVRVTTSEFPPITFFTFVTGPAPTAPSPNTSPAPVFGLHFFPPITVVPMAPPPTVNTSPSAETADHNTTEQQAAQQDADTRSDVQPDGNQQRQQQQQQPPQHTQSQQPHGPHPHALLATLLHSLLYGAPAAAAASGGAAGSALPTWFHPGDAVYTQEAFDRILTQLREQQQPAGPPPASRAALDRLQARGMREVDDQMLNKHGGGDGGIKCAVCVDDMVRGDRAAVLPCDHFFHGDCVLPWLKLHGTCPVCRRSVEVADDDDDDIAGDGKPVKLGGDDHAPPVPGAEAAEAETRGEVANTMNCS